MRSPTFLRNVLLTVPLIWLFVPCTASDRDGVSLPADGKAKHPQLESRVAPVYPPEARDAELEADVIVQAIIRKDGTVDGESAHCLRCSVHRKGRDPEEVLHGWCDDFCSASIEAVAQWRYTPGTVDGEPVDVYFTMVFSFELP